MNDQENKTSPVSGTTIDDILDREKRVPRTPRLAIASAVLGVLSLFFAGITSIPALICGYKARRIIKEQGLPGHKAVKIGLTVGYVGSLYFLAIVGMLLVATLNSLKENGMTIPSSVGNAVHIGHMVVLFIYMLVVIGKVSDIVREK